MTLEYKIPTILPRTMLQVRCTEPSVRVYNYNSSIEPWQHKANAI